jgi:hypothetical protein
MVPREDGVNKEAMWEAFSEFRGLLLSFEMECDQKKQSQSNA